MDIRAIGLCIIGEKEQRLEMESKPPLAGGLALRSYAEVIPMVAWASKAHDDGSAELPEF